MKLRYKMKITQVKITTKDKPISLPVAMINPFRFGVFKPEPNNRIRELTKAEALIVAEIDRLFNIERDVKDE